MARKKLIVIMGVSGSGKTTVAKHIAEYTSFKYMESDDFHSPENKAHMESGQPLTDEMRWPWIESICEAIQKEPDDIVLANSGLKFVHRDRFRNLNRECNFIHVKVPQHIIQARLELREGHFMPPLLLASQFRDMEKSVQGELIFELDGSASLSHMVAASLVCVQDIMP